MLLLLGAMAGALTVVASVVYGKDAVKWLVVLGLATVVFRPSVTATTASSRTAPNMERIHAGGTFGRNMTVARPRTTSHFTASLP